MFAKFGSFVILLKIILVNSASISDHKCETKTFDTENMAGYCCVYYKNSKNKDNFGEVLKKLDEDSFENAPRPSRDNIGRPFENGRPPPPFGKPERPNSEERPPDLQDLPFGKREPPNFDVRPQNLPFGQRDPPNFDVRPQGLPFGNQEPTNFNEKPQNPDFPNNPFLNEKIPVPHLHKDNNHFPNNPFLNNKNTMQLPVGGKKEFGQENGSGNFNPFKNEKIPDKETFSQNEQNKDKNQPDINSPKRPDSDYSSMEKGTEKSNGEPNKSTTSFPKSHKEEPTAQNASISFPGPTESSPLDTTIFDLDNRNGFMDVPMNACPEGQGRTSEGNCVVPFR